MATVALHTIGCKLNYAETSIIGKQFLDRGFRVVEFGSPADVIVINTCSVTERADRECRQLIRRALRSSSHACVVVTGCYAQLEPEEVASIDGVDIVLGSKEKLNLFDHVPELVKKSSARVFVSDIDSVDSFGPAYSTRAGERTRAFLKVQDGCDFNCSFCTIPLARGASRSLNIEECVNQANGLVAAGYKEIVLTGVNVGDYGKKEGLNLLALLRALVRVDGLERLRISSIEPNLLSQEIIDFVATEPVLCNHFHIPLQSGNEEILWAMRRRYTTRYYHDLVIRIKESIPECGIGADVIVGFPGESDAHFESTVSFLDSLPISYLHVFTYSERPNTPAGTLPGSVVKRIRSFRNEALTMLSRKKRKAFHERILGRTVPVLVENEGEDGTRFGFTDNYVKVGIPADSALGNAIVPVEILQTDGEVCTGRVSANCLAA